MYKGKVYFTKKGATKTLLDYVDTWAIGVCPEKFVEEDNAVFQETLYYTGYGRGRSSVVFRFRNSDDTLNVQMFVSDFDELIRAGASPIRVTGQWCYIKKGSNLGIQLVKL